MQRIFLTVLIMLGGWALAETSHQLLQCKTKPIVALHKECLCLARTSVEALVKSLLQQQRVLKDGLPGAFFQTKCRVCA